MDVTLDWWVWVIVGLGLLGLEVLTPGGFYLLFFGVSALLVGLLAAFGIVRPLWLQGLLFTLFAVLALLTLRRALVARFVPVGAQTDEVDALVGEVAVAMADLPVEGEGQAELRGTAWRVRNVGERQVARGQRCRVERVDGLTLWVRGI